MPKKFIKAVKGIQKAIAQGQIPKHYWKHRKMMISNPYAIARKATGYYGSSWHIGLKHKLRK